MGSRGQSILTPLTRREALLSFSYAAAVLPRGNVVCANTIPAAGPLCVFAHYMHCYVAGSFPSNDPRVEFYRGGGAALASPDRAVESQWFESDATATGGQAATDRDFELMASVGLDAAGLLIAPSHLPDSQFSHALNMAASAAKTSSVKIIPELWFDAPTTDPRMYGINVGGLFHGRPSALFRIDHRPVFLLSHQTKAASHSFDMNRSSAFLDVLFEGFGGRRNVFLIANFAFSGDPERENPFAHLADAVGAWTPQDDWLNRTTLRCQASVERLNKDFVYPVAPAFYQRRGGGLPMEYGNAFGSVRTTDAWIRIMAQRPKFIELMTWNDFSEDTAVRPTNTHSTAFLNLNAYFIQKLRGTAPSQNEERIMLFHPRQLARARLVQAGALTRNFGWRHASPTCDYVCVTTFLRAPAEVRIALGDDHWTFVAPEGFFEWLVFANPPVQRSAGDDTSVTEASFPQSGPRRVVVRVPSLSSGIVNATVTRGVRQIGSATSIEALADIGQYQDFTLISTDVTLYCD